MKKLCLLLLIFSSQTIFSQENHLIFLGGGGEPEGAQTTQFDGSVEALGTFFQDNKKNYKTLVNFNGGHIKTEAMIANKFKDAEIVNDLTRSNYKLVVSDTLARIESMPAGAKMIVFINSHGTEKVGKTHSISTSGSAVRSINSAGGEVVSLDNLAEVTKLAKEKNIKLAIIDGSCHAGNTLNVANSNTCVIAASGPDHYAYSNFADTFSQKMKAGKNLEEIFFETRAATKGMGFPMISTPEGMYAQDEIYPLLTPYMFFHDEYRGIPMDKIDIYLKNNATRSLVCEKNKEFEKLENILLLIQDVDKINQSNKNLKKLMTKLREYKKTQDQYLDRLIELNLPDLDTREPVVTVDYPSGNSYSHRELLSTDYNYHIIEKQKILENKFLLKSELIKAEKLKNFFIEAQNVKEGLFLKYPQYVQMERIIDELRKDEKVNIAIATDISNEAQDAYLKLYSIKKEQLKKSSDITPNPCKDFIL